MKVFCFVLFVFIAVAYLAHNSTSQFIIAGSQAGTHTGEEESGTMEECRLVAYSFWLVLS